MAEKATNGLVLKLSIEEVNIILEGLGEVAFKKSYALVDKIQRAATVQLGSNGHTVEDPILDLPETDKK